MYYAVDENGVRSHIDGAVKENKYYCPACHTQMVLKRGKIICHHFAHKSKCECDPWYNGNGKSVWHKEMQEKFCAEDQEVVVWDETHNVFHIADALRKENGKQIVYEFQHSPISPDDFIERSSFYLNLGYSLIWIFDYCTMSPKTIYYSEEEYSFKGRKLRLFVWPGKDRVRLFDYVQVRSFIEDTNCNEEGNLEVFFYISTGLGHKVQREYEGQLYDKWIYNNPFCRMFRYVKPDFIHTDDISKFYASEYEDGVFEERYILL